MNVAEIGQAYGLAVVTACSMAFGLGKAIQRGPSYLKSLGPLIPLTATIIASCSNLGLTRASEMMEGVSLTDSDGKV